jgi:transposase-like protein
MGLSRRQFTKEFKLAAIQRLEMGASVAEVARAFEVNPNVLHRWRFCPRRWRASGDFGRQLCDHAVQQRNKLRELPGYQW